MALPPLTIGRKIGLGFITILSLLLLASLLSYQGVGGIVHDAREVIAGNQLDGQLAQKEVDHLHWTQQVNALLTDPQVTTLTAQTDPRKCAFGQWYYGPERQRAELLVPTLAPFLAQIEEPHARLHQSAAGIAQVFHPADPELPGFLAAREVDHMRWSSQICRLFLDNEPRLELQTDPHQCAFGQWYYSPEAQKGMMADPRLALIYQALEEPHRHLHETAAAISQTYRQIHPGLLSDLKDLVIAHQAWAQKVAQGVIQGKTDFGVEFDADKCALAQWLQSPRGRAYAAGFPALAQALAKLAEPHKELHQSAQWLQDMIARGDLAGAQDLFNESTVPALAQVAATLAEAEEAERGLVRAQDEAQAVFLTQTMPLLQKTSELIANLRQEAERDLLGQREAQAIFASQTAPALEQVRALLTAMRQEARTHIMTDQVMLDAAQSTRSRVSLVSAVALGVGALLAFWLSKSICRALGGISAEIGMGAEQVAAAATQVASASQSQAQGAAQQAAGLEETSSSMEQMAAMTRRNADHSSQADQLVRRADQVVGQASQSMAQLRQAMDRTSHASRETAKIIQTIDEIAFQTNLLALNAAVEAARAGEAGAGFAVVADEVRALALRAAQAAHDTQALIKQNLEAIGQGSQLVTDTDQAFDQVRQGVQEVAQLMAAINTASQEQAQGIQQVNGALTQMDRVTQAAAANTEESAAASEELHAQAVSMEQTVHRLLTLVGAANVHHVAPRETAAPEWTQPRPPGLPPAPEAGGEDWMALSPARVVGGRRLG